MAILAAGTRLYRACVWALIKCRPAVITNVTSKSYGDGAWWKFLVVIFWSTPNLNQHSVRPCELSTEKGQLGRAVVVHNNKRYKTKPPTTTRLTSWLWNGGENKSVSPVMQKCSPSLSFPRDHKKTKEKKMNRSPLPPLLSRRGFKTLTLTHVRSADSGGHKELRCILGTDCKRVYILLLLAQCVLYRSNPHTTVSFFVFLFKQRGEKRQPSANMGPNEREALWYKYNINSSVWVRERERESSI